MDKDYLESQSQKPESEKKSNLESVALDNSFNNRI